jgi:hypothetical protein
MERIIMERLRPLVRACDVNPLEGFRVLVTFSDGTKREIDLAPFLHGPVFEPIKNNPEMFRSVRIEGNSIGWENGADIDPDVLYYGLQPAWKENSEAIAR